MIRCRMVIASMLLAAGTSLADEVFLKNAGSISGRIVEQTDEIVRVDIGGGTIGVPASEVERIVKGRTALDDYDERTARLGPGDVSGWRSLGRWASQQGLPAQAREAYDRVLELAPNDAEARKALGFVQVDGRWMTEEDGYRARGYVQYQGEWLTPAEVQVAQSQAAAEDARREAEMRAIEAEAAARDAERRAEQAEERAREAERDDWNTPVYWGGWGYGVTYWPSYPGGIHRPADRPTTLPSRVPSGGAK